METKLTFVEFVELASQIYRKGIVNNAVYITEEGAVLAATKIVDHASEKYTELIDTERIEAK